MTVFILFAWFGINAKPVGLYSDSEVCWADVAIARNHGHMAECRIATVQTPIAAIRPLPKPEVQK